jgi:predicted  nucleic acid-binding Zn-ribbon protein
MTKLIKEQREMHEGIISLEEKVRSFQEQKSIINGYLEFINKNLLVYQNQLFSIQKELNIFPVRKLRAEEELMIISNKTDISNV